MRKYLALVLLIATLFTLFAFAGCGKKISEPDTTESATTTPTRAPITHPEGFEPEVTDGSAILGTWKETEIVDGIYYEWTFFKNASMHRTSVMTEEDIRHSSVGYFDVNEDVTEMSYWLVSEGETATTTFTVKLDGDKMTFTAADGKVINLEKVTG